jgi:hypothetical protein
MTSVVGGGDVVDTQWLYRVRRHGQDRVKREVGVCGGVAVVDVDVGVVFVVGETEFEGSRTDLSHPIVKFRERKITLGGRGTHVVFPVLTTSASVKPAASRISTVSSSSPVIFAVK